MRVLVSGASGLVGSALVPALVGQGHEVVRLVRSTPAAGEVAWNPDAGFLDRPALEASAVEAVVHLAGESIAEGRWDAAKKARIRESRVRGTHLLAESLAALAPPPRVFASASAIGYYGDRRDVWLPEHSPPGTDFLARVCQEWEAATEPAQRAGIRVVHLRIGIVLTAEGGALARLLSPFQMGMGGPVGSGRQYVSWIDRDDLIGAVLRLLQDERVRGPVNLVAPNPVPNAELARTLGHVLGRPASMPAPAFAVRLLLGEMAEAILTGQRVEPRVLKEIGYRFQFPTLEESLRHALGSRV